VPRSIQTVLVLCMLCGLGGCFGPDYGPSYGYPTAGYAPYSYGVPVYARGYAPVFIVHHPWEQHHEEGHHESFVQRPAEAPHPAGPHAGGFSAYRGEAHGDNHH
jgi:hypothetical protein